MKLADRLKSLSPKAALGIASAVLLVEITVLTVATTKERKVRPQATPTVLQADLVPGAAGRGSALTVAAQASDGTIVRIDVRWPDGHTSVVKLGCRSDGRSFGGEIERRTIEHAHRVASADLRVTSSRCIMPGKPERASAWQTVNVAAS